jgi:hypothetical protein
MKPFQIYPPEFVASKIEVGDWVYLKSFDTFGAVEAIIPRVREKGSSKGFLVFPDDSPLLEYNAGISNSKLSARLHAAEYPLILLSRQAIVRFRENDYNYRFCASHCEKVTKCLLDTYIGDLVRSRLNQLKHIPL